MSRTLFAGLVLLGFVACGGSAENQAAPETRTRASTPPAEPAATKNPLTNTRSTTAPAPKRTATASKPSTTRSKTAATTKPDTTSRNPLTNR